MIDDPGELIHTIETTMRSLGIGDAELQARVAERIREALAEVDDDLTRPSVRTERDAPVLQLFEGDHHDDDDDGRVSVSVFRRSADFFGDQTLGLGTISLKVAQARQELVIGQRESVYRVHCRLGALTVWVDGAALVSLRAGQSIDLEGTRLAVVADTNEVEGLFRRL